MKIRVVVKKLVRWLWLLKKSYGSLKSAWGVIKVNAIKFKVRAKLHL